MIRSKSIQLTTRISCNFIKPRYIKPRLSVHQNYLRPFSTSFPFKMSNDQFQLSNLFNVKDKVALVTGGGSGIGLMVSWGSHIHLPC